MTHRYIYTDKVGAGPEHPKKRWGLFSTELTEAEARARYELDAARREDWFGIVRLDADQDRPVSYLQMCPRANGVSLQKLTPQGSIEADYVWGAYYDPSNLEPYTGDEHRVFLGGVTWYAYPDDDRFYRRGQAAGQVSMDFRTDGYAKEEQVTNRGFGQPADVETREFQDVDVSANWFDIPAFGEWDAFFHPDTHA
ncbi:hypothetical protein ACFQZV_09045 [Microbacterium koreense]|uniref:Uncharacterized protein n=1 Tax=Microbacterium koreense TaxID=323761 RepID=A0ABW2ZT70_9MICO